MSLDSDCIVLLGSSLDGHQESYTSEIVEIALRRVPRVALILNQTAQDTSELAALKKRFLGKLTVVVIADGVFLGWMRRWGQVIGQFVNFYNALRGVSGLGAPHRPNVWIICLDYFFWPTVLSSCIPFLKIRFGLLIQSQLTRNGVARARFSLAVYSLAWRILTREGSNFAVIYFDKSQGLLIRNCHRKRHKARYVRAPVILLPLIPRQDARNIIGLPQNRAIILVYGRVSSRKNIRGLIDTLNNSSPECSATIIVAGMIDDDQLEIIFNDSARMSPRFDFKVYGRRVSSEEERILFCACDLVWLNYLGHQTVSGVYDTSLAYGRVVAVPVKWKSASLVDPSVNGESVIFCEPDLTSMGHSFCKGLRAACLRSEETLVKSSKIGRGRVGTWEELEIEIKTLF